MAAWDLGKESQFAKTIHVSWVFVYLFLISCPSCLVWSGLILAICIALVVFMLFYLALRFACGVLRPSSRDLVRLGGFRSGSLLFDLVYRMAYLLVRVDLYPN